jgi:hypothetical protein
VAYDFKRTQSFSRPEAKRKSPTNALRKFRRYQRYRIIHIFIQNSARKTGKPLELCWAPEILKQEMQAAIDTLQQNTGVEQNTSSLLSKTKGHSASLPFWDGKHGLERPVQIAAFFFRGACVPLLQAYITIRLTLENAEHGCHRHGLPGDG